MWQLVLAGVGMFAPGGLFLYWVFNDYTSLSAALTDDPRPSFNAWWRGV